MPDVIIENPVINSPYEEPARHFRFNDDGITDEIISSRRRSEYFIPIAAPRKRGKQLSLPTQWTGDRIEPNDFVNYIRGRLETWRRGGYVGLTRTSRELLEYWKDPGREKKLFFCQIEALETAMYILEGAPRSGDRAIENRLRDANQDANPLLLRTAFKMATGTGKTVVMGMLIAWHTLNKLANPQDARFSDAFLIVSPGITIRDRLRVLLPNDPQNYYRERDILPPELLERLGQAKIVVTNYHALGLREQGNASRLTKRILAGHRADDDNAFKETHAQMVRRVCRELGNKKNVVVINDEAHHCYRRRIGTEDETLTGDDRREAQQRNEEARVWITGLEAVKQRLGIRALYDLSATPFFLRGSGYNEGVLFPWVVSDFSLIDAIEAGIVKVPRVPVSDDAMTGTLPTYRELWTRIRDDLPRKGRGTAAVSGEPIPPAELEGALRALYDNYEKAFRLWEADSAGQVAGQTPPVFIVVCNNTNVSKLVFDWIAGWPKPLDSDPNFLVDGNLPIFSNVRNGSWAARPNTILVDSAQLESGEAMSPEFKRIAAVEIDRFHSEIRARGGNPEDVRDEDLLREVMNTVGKPGRLGENIKCVVSVSMLTEGWDANTVTHVLGVRAFGTQLLCEQVVGRALRRRSYATEPREMEVNGQMVAFEAFSPEYAEVFGVPFSFIPTAGHNATPKLGPIPTRVRALEERIDCEIPFPRLVGYKYEFGTQKLNAQFNESSHLALSTSDVPTSTENAPIVGESVTISLDELRQRRPQEVAFKLAKRTLEKYFRDDDNNLMPWFFPQVLDISSRWLTDCVVLKDNTFPQLLLLAGNAEDAADKIYRSIARPEDANRYLRPTLRSYDTVGSTRYVDFDTTRPTFLADPLKSHISHVSADTDSWEQKAAQSLEAMPEVVHYVKNQGLNFMIPYTLGGEERNYFPDFLVHYDDGRGVGDLLNLIVEVSGEAKKDKAVKVATARDLWVPAVNAHGGFGRWAFIEVTDPWDLQNTVRAVIRQGAPVA